MPSIASGFSAFTAQGIDASNKKMTDQEIARWKKLQESTGTGAANIASQIAKPVDLSQVKKLDASLAVRQASPEEKAQLQKIRELAYTKITNLDELANHPSQQIYAEVKVDGKVVATLYNSGAAQTSNALGGKLGKLPSMGEEEQSTGPELAQKRAEEIAAALGGSVEISGTALTQADYIAVPAFKPEFKVDYEAMERDIQTALGRVATSQTATDTQKLAAADSVDKSVVDEFLEFNSKSWEERMRTMILNSMGLKEENLATMSAAEREKIEAKIKEKIDEEVEKKTGMAVGSAASAV